MTTPDTPPNRSALDYVARTAVAVAGAALVGMAGVEAWQVFARYVMNASPSWTEPVALLFMSTAMMFGAAAGVRGGRHFGFFLLVEHAAPGLRRVLFVVSGLIATGIGAMLAYWGGEMTFDAWNFRMAGAPLPQGVVFLPMCLGGTLIAIFAIERLLAQLAAHSGQQPSSP